MMERLITGHQESVIKAYCEWCVEKNCYIPNKKKEENEGITNVLVINGQQYVDVPSYVCANAYPLDNVHHSQRLEALNDLSVYTFILILN